MAKVDETGNAAPLKSSLDAGIRTISAEQEIVFFKYTRAVLPLDGYVFWVKDLMAPEFRVRGSLHYDTDQQQRVDEIIGLNRVVFTTQEQIESFNAISDAVAYIGSIDDIRFAFTAQGRKYQQADTYHYRGDAIYPAMYSQIIDSPADPLDLGELIATNSLPIWLALNRFMPMFPAYLTETNLRPPYAAIDITETKAVQSAPEIANDSTHLQLMTEKVKIIMMGLRNNEALDFLDYVLDYSLSSDSFGIQNSPSIQDEKRGQSELGILAQKKTIEFEINYYQSRSLAVGRKLIESAGITVSL